MKEKPIDIIDLDNGLTLELFDRSRLLAGDRCRVCLAARIRVPVRPDHLVETGGLEVDYDRIRSVLGDQVSFYCEKVRNFIDRTEKDEILDDLKADLLENIVDYISDRDFPGRLIIRKYKEATSPERFHKWP